MELVRTKRTDALKELMDQRRSLDDALAVIEEYGDSTAERYRKFRYNWPRTAEDKRVHAARKAASHFWQTAERCLSCRACTAAAPRLKLVTPAVGPAPSSTRSIYSRVQVQYYIRDVLGACACSTLSR